MTTSMPYPLSLRRALKALPAVDPDDHEQVARTARDRLPLLDDVARDYLVRYAIEKVFTAASRDTVAPGLATYGETADEVVFDEQRTAEAQAYLAARSPTTSKPGRPRRSCDALLAARRLGARPRRLPRGGRAGPVPATDERAQTAAAVALRSGCEHPPTGAPPWPSTARCDCRGLGAMPRLRPESVGRGRDELPPEERARSDAAGAQLAAAERGVAAAAGRRQPVRVRGNARRLPPLGLQPRGLPVRRAAPRRR